MGPAQNARIMLLRFNDIRCGNACDTVFRILLVKEICTTLENAMIGRGTILYSHETHLILCNVEWFLRRVSLMEFLHET